MAELGLPWAIPVIVGVLAAGTVAAWLVSRLVGWGPAGPITLLAAAPLVPSVQIFAHLSTDDLLPLWGLVLLFLSPGWRSLGAGRLARLAFWAVAVATVARIVSSLVNGDGAAGTASMLVEAIARPAVLVATVMLVASTNPAQLRRRVAVTALASVGTFEAAFSLVAFVVGLPGGLGVQPERLFETLGGCAGRITGTLGLSPNHVGAVFVVAIPLTLALATGPGTWRRWAWLGAASLQGTALMLTFTRSSIVLAAFAAVATLVVLRQWAALAAGLVLTAALTIGATTLACPAPGVTPPPSPSPSASAPSPSPTDPSILDRFGDQNDRLALWYAATRMMLDHPVAGVGLGRMNAELVARPDRYRETPYGVATNSAHNTILLAGAETGVLGAGAMLVLNAALALMALAWIITWGRSATRAAAGFALLGFLGQGMVNNLFTVPATATLMALLLGAFLVASDRHVVPGSPQR